jgi:hypothetical protein
MSPQTITRPVGKNDFGVPEDTVMTLIVPLRLPAGTVLHDHRTGARFDSDGKLIPVIPESGTDESRHSDQGQSQVACS